MRVLFLSHCYTDITKGGLAEFLHYLPLNLKTRDIKVYIYTQSPTKNCGELQGPVLLKNSSLHYSGPLLKPRWYISKKELTPLLLLCKKEKIDLIHAQGVYRAGYAAMCVKKRLKIPYIVTSHSDISEVNSKRIRRPKIKNRCKRILKNANYVTHLTPFMANYSHQIYDTRNKSVVIHNGIDITEWKTNSDLPSKDYIFAIGRLEPEKGFSVLIDAYAKLIKQKIKTSLVIAGEGSNKNALVSQAKALGLNVIIDSDTDELQSQSVIFPGYVRGEQKKALFRESKFIVFPSQAKSWDEAFGIVQLEAMVSGKNLIASDIEAVRYLQSLGLHATLVKPDNINEWTNAMLFLLHDEEFCLKSGKANYHAVNQFDWKRVAAEYEKVYRAILK